MKVLNWLSGVLLPKPPPNVWGNVIHVIYPYLWNHVWVFDDPRVELDKEAFVAGADTFIDMALNHMGIQGRYGFRATFSAIPFPGHQFSLKHKQEGREGDKTRLSFGNTYVSKEFGVEGWLCPALFRYFKEAPKEIFIKFEEAPEEFRALRKKEEAEKPKTTFRTHWKPQIEEDLDPCDWYWDEWLDDKQRRS